MIRHVIRVEAERLQALVGDTEMVQHTKQVLRREVLIAALPAQNLSCTIALEKPNLIGPTRLQSLLPSCDMLQPLRVRTREHHLQ